ncbi:MAG: B12-binding domain-containing radical SAM protein, partial [bacterium]|nr:B12-binding domain-containing radical SAM protein [bacterium]
MGGGVFANQLAEGSPELEYFLEKTRDYIDKIIIGEGEILFLEYMQGKLPAQQRVYTLRDIQGKTLDITRGHMVDFSDFDVAKYPYLASFASRSCPFNCSFCTETLQWGRYRKRDLEAMVEELIEISRRCGNQLFLLCDSLLNPIITPLSNRLIEAGQSLYWDGYLRVDKAAAIPENVYLWRRAGFYRARLGIESGSQNILEKMDKKITPAQVETTVTSLANYGIKTSTMWLIGHPGETEEDFQQTLDLIEELKDDIYDADVNTFNYYPTGQVNSSVWLEKNKSYPLYPEKFREMLMVQTWQLNAEPAREEIYKRLNRFKQHLDKLGIPNPYTMNDIYRADERWRQLHTNAVPSVVEFRNNEIKIDENKRVQKISLAETTMEEEGDFDF